MFASTRAFMFVMILIGVFVGVSHIDFFTPAPFDSVEVGFAEETPALNDKGLVIPASCASDPHFSGHCDPPTFEEEGGGSVPTIVAGDSVTLEWDCPFSTSSTGVNFSTGGAASGTAIVSPTETTTYQVICFHAGTGVLTVTVLSPEGDIRVVPTLIRPGDSTNLIWTASNVNSCTVTGPNGFTRTATSGNETIGPITAQETYSLDCLSDGDPVNEETTLLLIPQFIEF